MKRQSEFVIQFVGLSNGIHHFSFLANTLFFDSIESELIKSGVVEVILELEKNNNMLHLQFNFEGTVDVLCDRCLVSYALPISGSEMMIVKTAGEVFDEQDEIITLPQGSYEIDLSHQIFDMIAVSIPLKVVPCEVADNAALCDQEVLGRIKNYSQTKEQQNDPRWEKLNQLRNKEN